MAGAVGRMSERRDETHVASADRPECLPAGSAGPYGPTPSGAHGFVQRPAIHGSRPRNGSQRPAWPTRSR
jgi:hypothetical protein